MANSASWQRIFDDLKIAKHNFDESPFFLSAEDIKRSCQNFQKTGEKEVRVLCKQDTRENRPDIFKELGLFLLPVKNGRYAILNGEGYIDIPTIKEEAIFYSPNLEFPLETAKIGDSEMQHLDYAYAVSVIRTFMNDQSLILTIRGRKYTPNVGFDFKVGNHLVNVTSVQTEVDVGYEGKNQVVLIEAKRPNVKNTIIRQLYYPFRQWQNHTKKKVATLFFNKDKEHVYSIWQFEFQDPANYNSMKLVKCAKFHVIEK